MPDLQSILDSQSPLTLASVPSGFTPLLLADLARAAPHRTLFIASDDTAMRGVADAVPFFAAELEILQFPAWDCLPYDRASPSLAITSQRMAAFAGPTTVTQGQAAYPDDDQRRSATARHAFPDSPDRRAATGGPLN